MTVASARTPATTRPGRPAKASLVRDEDRAVPPGSVGADHGRRADDLPVGEGHRAQRSVGRGAVEDAATAEGHAGDAAEAHARGRHLEGLRTDDLALGCEVAVVQPGVA